MVDPIPSPWPERRLGAVSLTFDDGMPTHLSRAVPLLEEHGLRGTFYVNPRGDDWLERLAPWRGLAERGHEIGNHTVNHPCSRALWPDPHTPCLEEMTLADIEAEMLEASRRLREAIPSQEAFTYAYPCYQEHVGAGATRQTYVPLAARHFIAARGRGEWGRNYPAHCDPAYLYSWNAEFLNGQALVGRAEEAAARACWVIFTFHGVDQGHLPISEVALRELCDHLRQRNAEIWTAPLVTVARALERWRD